MQTFSHDYPVSMITHNVDRDKASHRLNHTRPVNIVQASLRRRHSHESHPLSSGRRQPNNNQPQNQRNQETPTLKDKNWKVEQT